VPDVEKLREGTPAYRYELTRSAGGAGGRGANWSADITSRVVSAGPLDERLEEQPGVGAVASLTLECVPDDALAADGPAFAGLAAPDDVELIVWAAYKGGEEAVFHGVMAAAPEYREGIAESLVVLRFVGRLAAMWDDEPMALRRRGQDVGWGHATDELLPALLAAGRFSPARYRLEAPALAAASPFWSCLGDPAAALDPARDVPYDVGGLAWDPARRVVYVGVGPYVRSYEPATRRWVTVAHVRYGGNASEPKNVTWRVAHLEYDAASARLLGVAESAGADVTKRANHLKALFAVSLAAGEGG